MPLSIWVIVILWCSLGRASAGTTNRPEHKNQARRMVLLLISRWAWFPHSLHESGPSIPETQCLGSASVKQLNCYTTVNSSVKLLHNTRRLIFCLPRITHLWLSNKQKKSPNTTCVFVKYKEWHRNLQWFSTLLQRKRIKCWKYQIDASKSSWLLEGEPLFQVIIRQFICFGLFSFILLTVRIQNALTLAHWEETV